ncbi:hypothetical protein IOLA_293 [uncultured bacterium]|nr:hypothetical protein IOLA_293 [uncultured bacterium]
MSVGDLENELDENLMLSMDSFQLYNLISSLSIIELNNKIYKISSTNIIIIYYRLPHHLKRKLIKSSVLIKQIIRQYELQNSIAGYFEPAIILNISDLSSNIVTEKIKNNGHILDFFVKDFIIIQDNNNKYAGILYLRDIIKLMHNQYFEISLSPRIVLLNKKFISNKDIVFIDEDSKQLIIHNYFTIENYDNFVMCVINIDYVFDDFLLFQNKSIGDDSIFFLQKKEKLLNMMFIIFSTIFSTCLIGLISAIMNFRSQIIIVADLIAAINEGFLVVITQNEINKKRTIIYALMISLLINSIFMLIYVFTGHSITSTCFTTLITFTSNFSSIIIMQLLISLNYNISFIILLIDTILISSMFLINYCISL